MGDPALDDDSGEDGIESLRDASLPTRDDVGIGPRTSSVLVTPSHGGATQGLEYVVLVLPILVLCRFLVREFPL